MTGAGPRRAAADIAVQLVGRVLNLLLGIVVIVLLTRELGARGFGEWSAIFAIVQIASYLGDLGLEPAAVKRASAADEDERPAILGALLFVRFLLTVPATLASVVTVLLIASSDDMVTAGVIGSLTLLVSAGTALRVVFQLRVRNDVPIAVMTVNSVLWAASVVFLSAAGSGGLVTFAAALLAVNTITTALLAGLSLRAMPVVFTDLRRHAWELLKVGTVVGIGFLLISAYVRIDQILVLHYTDEHQAGLYGAAYQLLDKAQFLPVAVLTTLLPLLAAAHATDRERLRRIVTRAFELLGLVSLPILAFSLVAAEPFVLLLFGEEFRDAAPALSILMAAFVVSAFSYVVDSLALVVGTQGRLAGIAAAALVFNVAINVALLPSYGYLVAAWTTLATELLVFALCIPITFGRLHLRLPIGRMPRIVLSSVIMAAAVWGLRAAGSDILWLLLAAVLVYPVAALAVRAVDLTDLRAMLSRGAG